MDHHKPGDRRIPVPSSLAFSSLSVDLFPSAAAPPDNPSNAAVVTQPSRGSPTLTVPPQQPTRASPPATVPSEQPAVANGPATSPLPVDPILPRPEYPSQSLSPPPSSANNTTAAPAPHPGVRYGECLKNHAASVGGHVLDGCCEFMPAGQEQGSTESLKCAVCGCHRSFHRKEVEGEQQCATTPSPLATAHHRLSLPYYHYYYYGAPHMATANSGHHRQHYHRRSRIHPQQPSPPPLLALPPPVSSQGVVQTATPPAPSAPMTAFRTALIPGGTESSGGTTTESSSDEHEGPNTPVTSSPGGGGPTSAYQVVGSSEAGLPVGSYAAPPPPSASALSRKRFRTKFTGDQKDRMLEFADAIGWRMQRKDEGSVERFCADVGVPRKVFKVWMHNNKHVSTVRKQHQHPEGVGAGYHQQLQVPAPPP